MSDKDILLEELKQRLLETEGEIMDQLVDYSLDELLIFYGQLTEDIIESEKFISNIIKKDNKIGHEAIFSTFRVMKAILAEIEYRIRENKI